jgi:hypothetical protein
MTNASAAWLRAALFLLIVALGALTLWVSVGQAR